MQQAFVKRMNSPGSNITKHMYTVTFFFAETRQNVHRKQLFAEPWKVCRVERAHFSPELCNIFFNVHFISWIKVMNVTNHISFVITKNRASKNMDRDYRFHEKS